MMSWACAVCYRGHQTGRSGHQTGRGRRIVANNVRVHREWHTCSSRLCTWTARFRLWLKHFWAMQGSLSSSTASHLKLLVTKLSSNIQSSCDILPSSSGFPTSDTWASVDWQWRMSTCFRRVRVGALNVAGEDSFGWPDASFLSHQFHCAVYRSKRFYIKNPTKPMASHAPGFNCLPDVVLQKMYDLL